VAGGRATSIKGQAFAQKTLIEMDLEGLSVLPVEVTSLLFILSAPVPPPSSSTVSVRDGFT